MITITGGILLALLILGLLRSLPQIVLVLVLLWLLGQASHLFSS